MPLLLKKGEKPTLVFNTEIHSGTLKLVKPGLLRVFVGVAVHVSCGVKSDPLASHQR